MSLPAHFESDYLVDDGDAFALHFRRHGSAPTAQELTDITVPGLVSWRAGRQLWAGSQHRKHMAGPAYDCDTPLFEHRPGVVPDDVLDIVDGIGWAPGLVGANRLMMGRYAEGDRLVPRVERRLTSLCDQIAATAPFRFSTEPAEVVYLTHRKPGTHDDHDNHTHADDAYDPFRRWLSLILYFSSSDDYEGGDLVIEPTGERLRPDRGDAVLLRGDVQHRVEPVTAGARSTLTAHIAEPRWWVEPRDEIEAADPDERCRVLDRLFTEGRLDRAALRRGVALAWSDCHYPEEQLPADRWVALWRAAGYVSDWVGNWRPTQPVRLFRASDPGWERRLTWTSNRAAAEWFQVEFDRAELWRAVVPAEDVLAWFGAGGGFEVVVDPAALSDLERVE